MRQSPIYLLEGYEPGTGYTKGYIDSYHRTNARRDPNNPNDVEQGILDLIHTGFKPAGGDMYGKGLYSTGDWESQFGGRGNDDMSFYGIGIIKYRTPAKGVLVFDYRVAKKIYGAGKEDLASQLEDLGIYNTKTMPEFIIALSEDLRRTYRYPKLSADRALSVWKYFWQDNKKYDDLLKHLLSAGYGYPALSSDVASLYLTNGARNDATVTRKISTDNRVLGIAFSGNHDGNVLFVREKKISAVMPLMYCIMDRSRSGDSKAFIIPWTPVKSGVSAAGMMAGFVDILRAVKIPSGRNSFDVVLLQDMDKMGSTASINYIKDNFKWAVFGSCRFSQLDAAFNLNKEDFIFGGIWQGGECNVHYFGNPDNIMNELKAIDKGISFNQNQTATFHAGTFTGDEFAGDFVGGVFERGIFNGVFKGGVLDFDKKIIWGPKAQFKPESTLARSIRYQGKLYNIGDTDPEIFLANLKAGIAVQSSKGIKGVDDAKSLEDAVKNKLSFPVSDISIQNNYHKTTTIPLGFAEIVRTYPWLFKAGQHITWKADPILEISNDKISVISGDLRTGDVYFDVWEKKSSVIGGNILGNNRFEGTLNGGNYREGTFAGTYNKGTIFLDNTKWDSKAIWEPKNLPVFKYKNNTYEVRAFMLLLPDASGKKPLFKSIDDIITAVKNGTFIQAIRKYDKEMRDFQARKGPAPVLLPGKSVYSKATLDSLGIQQQDIDTETDEWNSNDGAALLTDSIDFSKSDVTYLHEKYKLSEIRKIDLALRHSLTEQIFHYDDLAYTEQETLYKVFADSYVKATGAAFDKEDFDWRAAGWTFFGNPPNENNPAAPVGGIAVRKQQSNNMFKLVASFGDFRSVLRGFDEFKSKHGRDPVWGIVTPEILKLVTKHDKDFKILPGIVVKAMEGAIKKFSNGEVKSVGLDGTMQVNTPAGVMKKMFLANIPYIHWLIDSVEDPSNASRLPVPQIVLAPLISLVKALI